MVASNPGRRKRGAGAFQDEDDIPFVGFGVPPLNTKWGRCSPLAAVVEDLGVSLEFDPVDALELIFPDADPENNSVPGIVLIMVSEEANSKNQRNEDFSINSLPEDLIERVLLKLPVSTLLRCVGVCKRWKTMIRNPEFTTLHLQRASHYALLFFQPESIEGRCYPSDAILIDEALSPSTYAVPVIGPDDLLCGSCNGLLCLYTKTSTLKIANLATGESIYIEKPIKNLRGDHFSFYSFGFHPSKKEYKITHFLGDYVQGVPKNKDTFNVIQVYTLGDEQWKDIRTPEALSLNCVRKSGAINVDGTMYWLAEDMSAGWQHVVMSFDSIEESFAQIPLPTSVIEDLANAGPRKYWIREIDGKICIATSQTCRSQPKVLFGKLQIWTLENKVEHMWSQKYNIHSSDYIPGPNLVHVDKLLMQRNDRKLFAYELEWNGENFKNSFLNMVNLLDFNPRKPENMQYYICVKSVVRLDVYKKGGAVRRANKRKGWQSKKWEAWENKLSQMEQSWTNMYQNEQEMIASSKQDVIWLKDQLAPISDDVIQQQILMKVDQIIPKFPDKQPRSLRRLNLVGEKQDRENLVACMENFVAISEATTNAIRSATSIIESVMPNEGGASRSNAIISSQYHSDGEDTIET